MPQENLIGFGECVLALHEKLRKFVKQSDLFEELNSMIHKMMDATAKRRYSLGCTLGFSKNCRGTSIREKRNSLRLKKTCYNPDLSKCENGVSDFEIIKPCFVKLDKICDIQLSKLLAKKMYSNKVRSNSRGLEMSSLQSTIERIHNPSINLGHDRNIDISVNINIDPKFLATEDHLDLLMAREMESSYPQKGKRFSGKVKSESTKSIKDYNLNPVVLLERLSPQFISKAINGKLEMESQEFTRRRKRKVSSLQRMAVTTGLRRSERLSNISLSTEGRYSCFYSGRNSCPSRRQHNIKDNKEIIFGNKENIPRPRKRSYEKINNSDDEEEFYGFENQTKNRQRIKKMKEALKTLNDQPSGKEIHRILKVKKPLKTFHLLSSGKENGRTAILNRDNKSCMRHKVPFKAVNRVEGQCSTNEDIFKNSTIEDYQSSIRDNHLNTRDKMMMRRNNAQCNNAGADVMAVNRLEILKLFKKREKQLISKIVRDQGKVIVSKTGELWNGDNLLEEPLDYYSDKYYFKRAGRRVPLWAEESITNRIIESQEQIPTDIIVGYFQDHDATETTSIAEFLWDAFVKKDDVAVKER